MIFEISNFGGVGIKKQY